MTSIGVKRHKVILNRILDLEKLLFMQISHPIFVDLLFKSSGNYLKILDWGLWFWSFLWRILKLWYDYFWFSFGKSLLSVELWNKIMIQTERRQRCHKITVLVHCPRNIHRIFASLSMTERLDEAFSVYEWKPGAISSAPFPPLLTRVFLLHVARISRPVATHFLDPLLSPRSTHFAFLQ